jgi:hypothetical protein
LSERIEHLRKIFENLGISIEFCEKPLARKWAIVVYNEEVVYIELGKHELESDVALITYAIFKAMYRRIKQRLKNKEKLADKAYYWIVGYLGNYIRADVHEETKKEPKWLKKLPLLDWTHPEGFYIDHPFYSINGEFVSEPYTMGLRDFKNLVKFCEKYNLDFVVEGESKHFPGHTFRVRLKPRDGQR